MGQPSCTFDVVTGTTTNPAQAASWNYFDPAGAPIQAQETNINLAASLGNVDQPWLLVNPDPTTPGQDNVYVAYDDFSNNDGVDGADMRVAVSYGVNPPNFTLDRQIGNSTTGINPGLRLANDSRTGFMWGLWGRCTSGCDADGPKGIDYMLNRSTDGGNTWTLNGNALGVLVVNATSTQPRDKFGTVNALLGGVHHAAVDQNTGDLYYAYGNRDAGTGNDRLSLGRIVSDGAGGVVGASNEFITGQVEAAIPSVAVSDNGTVGVFYYTFDGFSSDDFPIFTAHLALSEDKGITFTTVQLLRFLSSAKDDGKPRQRVLGDYQQMKTVADCFYGSFTGNGAPLGRPVSNHDPIFFKVCVAPQIQVPGNVTMADTCVGDTSVATLNVCNTGVSNLVVSSIASSSARFVVTTPTAGYPVVISPDFCFPFQVTFSPTATGQQTAVLTVTSNDPASPTVKVGAAGKGIQKNIATVIADNGNFGDVCRDSFKDLTLIINNSGGCDLTISDITSSSLDFQVPNVGSFPLVVGGGDSIKVPIRFAPTTLGAKNGTITITSDDSDTPNKQVAVSGNVPPGDIRVTGSTDFGDVCAGVQTEKVVSVCNVGECNLNVSSVSFVGDCPDFTLINNPFPAPVSPDSCESVTIRFKPKSCGEKSCTLRINSDDPDTPVVDLTVTANTPCNDIDVSPDQCFTPTVIQSVGACKSLEPFPISNKGSCPIKIPSIALSGANSGAYSLSGLPSFPINLQPGHTVGDGDLDIGFAPLNLGRDTPAKIDVTYETDPITHATTVETRLLNGEGVRTGARVLVTHNGVAVPLVEKIMIQRITGNRNRRILDTVDNAMNLKPKTVTPAAPCGSFQYHREYSTVSNPIQLLPGSYQITATAVIGKKKVTKAIGFDVSTCGFNANIVIELP